MAYATPTGSPIVVLSVLVAYAVGGVVLVDGVTATEGVRVDGTVTGPDGRFDAAVPREQVDAAVALVGLAAALVLVRTAPGDRARRPVTDSD